jgi:hypothetical protein
VQPSQRISSTPPIQVSSPFTFGMPFFFEAEQWVFPLHIFHFLLNKVFTRWSQRMAPEKEEKTLLKGKKLSN